MRFLAIIVRDWQRRVQADAFLVAPVGWEWENPTITAGEVADYIQGIVGYEVQVVFGIEGGIVPLPLAPDTHIDLRGPRRLYYRAL